MGLGYSLKYGLVKDKGFRSWGGNLGFKGYGYMKIFFYNNFEIKIFWQGLIVLHYFLVVTA